MGEVKSAYYSVHAGGFHQSDQLNFLNDVIHLVLGGAAFSIDHGLTPSISAIK